MVLRIFILACLVFTVMMSSSFTAELRLIDAKDGDNAGDRFGDQCEGLGDVNGDGYADFLLTEFASRKLHLYLGGPKPFENPPAITWDNHGSPSQLQSFKPFNVGDIGCDGASDFMTVFYRRDTVKIFLGMNNLDKDEYLVIPIDASIGWDYFYFGGGGDNNTDGNPDFLVYKYEYWQDTVVGYNGCGALDTIADYAFVFAEEPDSSYRTIGSDRICNTCDLNGDSIADIVFGEYDGAYDGPGRVSILWGGQTISQQPDLVFYCPDTSLDYSLFGLDIACLGDISGDGIDDIWIHSGRGYIYFGGQPFDTIVDMIVDYPYSHWIENIGDINNDGWNDVLLTYTNALYSQVAYLYCGPDMDTLVDAVWDEDDFRMALSPEIIGPVVYLGTSFSRAGDVDGDGIDDVLISARESLTENHDEGWIFIQAGWQDPVDTDNEQDLLPPNYELRQNYPNPFNAGTTIEFYLTRSGYTEIRIFNLLGEEVAVPLRQHLPVGEHRAIWDGLDKDGSTVPTGIYFYQISSGDYSQARKMILVK